MTITTTDLFLGALLAVVVVMAYYTVVERLQQRRHSLFDRNPANPRLLSQQERDLLRPQKSAEFVRTIQRHTHQGHQVAANPSQSELWERATPNHPLDADDTDADDETPPPSAIAVAEEVRRLVQSGQMVKALQYYREHAGVSLKNAKKAVRRIAATR